MERETGGCLHKPGWNQVSTIEEGAQCNSWHGSREGVRNNYDYNWQQKGAAERELG